MVALGCPGLLRRQIVNPPPPVFSARGTFNQHVGLTGGFARTFMLPRACPFLSVFAAVKGGEGTGADGKNTGPCFQHVEANLCFKSMPTPQPHAM